MPTPPMIPVTPGSARWPGALRTVTANHTRAAATIAPITTSTYRKAARENTVPRRTIVTSRHTQTRATWADAMPRIVITCSGVSGSDPSSGSANAHTINACTNTVPASTTTSTARSAPTVSFPTAHPSIDLRWESIERRVGGGFAPWRDAAAPSHGMAFARTVLILSKSASLEHKSDATRLRRRALSRCWVCGCLTVRRGVVGPGAGLGSGRGGPAVDAGDLLPDGEADGHFGAVVRCGHQVAAGPEVG
jgi:hypothetical protein